MSNAPLPVAVTAPAGGSPPLARSDHWRGFVKQFYARIRKPNLAPGDRLQACIDTAEALLAARSDGQALRIAVTFSEVLPSLDDSELLQFFLVLARRFGPDEAVLRSAASAYVDKPSPEVADRLSRSAEPSRLELLRRLNMAPDATALIVLLREKLLKCAKAEPQLAPLAGEMQQLLSSWFNRGFLKVEKLDWSSPASVLENVIRYEAVHKIKDWDSLRSRLQGNRRCFGFFHPALAGVPLIFIEVALTREISSDIASVLAGAEQESPLHEPTHAIFYSINNCHVGLKGINLGDLLIKQVVLELRAEFPSLKQFVTLSPIPGFRRWLEKTASAADLLSPATLDLLTRPDWHLDKAFAEQVRGPLRALCATYLTGRSPNGSSDGRVSDPVARFHLSNGARLERINWLGDTSPKGMMESFGLMVNYHYQLNSIDANRQVFVEEDRVVISPSIKQLREGSSHHRPRFSLAGTAPSRRAREAH